MSHIKKLKVLCTSAGNDGFQAVHRALRQDERITILACDSSENAYGLFIADAGFVIPPRSDEAGLLDQIKQIIVKEGIDCLFPLSTQDQEFYSKHISAIESLGCRVLVSDYESVIRANNKHELYRYLSLHSIPLPKFFITGSREDAARCIKQYLENDLSCVIKISHGTGAQGVKIVDPALTWEIRFFSRDNIRVSYPECMLWIERVEEFPEIMICEYLPGVQVSVDVLSLLDTADLYFSRTEDAQLFGMGMFGQSFVNANLCDVAREIICLTNLKYINNLEFKADAEGVFKLLEINPRIPASIDHALMAGLNFPLMAVLSVLGYKFDVPEKKPKVKYFRYWNSTIDIKS